MAIGTSLGGFFQSEMEMHVAPFQEKDKGIQPETGLDTNDDNELPGNPGKTKSFDVKDEMPFPDNKDPRMDFSNRFGNLPPSGILNDLKKPNPDQNIPLVRKISDHTGFRQSDDIYDQRDLPPYSLKGQLNDDLDNLFDKDRSNKPIKDLHTEVGTALGVDDIHTEKRSLWDRFTSDAALTTNAVYDDLIRSGKLTKEIFNAAVDYYKNSQAKEGYKIKYEYKTIENEPIKEP